MIEANETIPPGIGHQVLDSADTHFLGRNYIPFRHVTAQTIQALKPIDKIAYKVLDKGTGVRGLMGCTASKVEEIEQGVYASMLTLKRPLRPRQITQIEFTTSFNYGAEAADQPPPEFRRRIVGAHAWRQWQVAVYFPTQDPPKHVLWAEWEGPQLGSPIVPGSEQELKLEPMNVCSGEFLVASHVMNNVPLGKVLGMVWQRPERV